MPTAWGGMSFGWTRQDGRLLLGVSCTSDMDNFNKKVSHAIIAGRIQKGLCYEWLEPEILKLSDDDITKQLAKQFGNDKGFLNQDAYYKYRNSIKAMRIINLD